MGASPKEGVFLASPFEFSPMERLIIAKIICGRFGVLPGGEVVDEGFEGQRLGQKERRSMATPTTPRGRW